MCAPKSLMNAGMGGGHYYIDPVKQLFVIFNGITDIASMVFDFLVWVATGGVLLLLAHLVKEGLKAISNLVSTAISVVEAAVDRIVDAFCAMVDWVIEFIKNTFNSLIAEPLHNLWESLEAWVFGLLSTVKNVCSRIDNGEIGAFHAAEEIFEYIFGSTTIKMLMAIVTLVVIGVSLLECLTRPFGFVLMLISPILIDIIMQGLVSAMSGVHWLIDSMIDGADQMCNSIVALLTSEGVQLGATVVSVISVLGSFFFGKLEFFGDIGIENLKIKQKLYSALSFLTSCIGLFILLIDFTDDQDDNAVLDLVGLTVTGIGIVFSWLGDISSIVGKISVGFSMTSLTTGIVDVID